MLESQIIKNTWKCDGCGIEAESVVSPYFNVVIQLPTLPNMPYCGIDLCDNCIPMITAQAAVDYVNNSKNAP